MVVDEWHSALGVTMPACRWLAEVFPSGQVVLEEDLPHELAPTSHAGLVEDRLEVVLHGVDRQVQPLGDVLGGAAFDAQARYRAFSSGQAVGERHDRRHVARR